VTLRFFSWELCLRVRLHILKRDNAAEYPSGKRFGFAVIDLDKAEEYPANFVCMLPLRLGSRKNDPSIFLRVFGDESLSLARKLLGDALEEEDDPNVRAEIERRLLLLDPPSVCNRVCVSCGRVFRAELGRSFGQKFCEDCLRKFGGRK
jgi:hypothetical protein